MLSLLLLLVRFEGSVRTWRSRSRAFWVAWMSVPVHVGTKAVLCTCVVHNLGVFLPQGAKAALDVIQFMVLIGGAVSLWCAADDDGYGYVHINCNCVLSIPG